MRADLGAFLDDDDAALGIELLQPDRGGEAGGAGADDDDVIFHRLAGGQFGIAGHRAQLLFRAPPITERGRAQARRSLSVYM